MTSKKIDYQSSSVTSGISPEEEAAVLAAVYAYLDQEEQSVEDPSVAKESSWARSAHLEVSGSFRGKLTRSLPASLPKNLWQAITRPFVPVLVLCSLSLSSSAVYAQQVFAPLPGNDEGSQFRPVLQGNHERSFVAGAPQDDMARNVPKMVRVGIALGQEAIEIAAPDGAQIVDLATKQVVAVLPKESAWVCRTQADAICLQNKFMPAIAHNENEQSSNYEKVSYTPNLTVITEGAATLPEQMMLPGVQANYAISAPNDLTDGLLAINGKFYRGSIELSCRELNSRPGATTKTQSQITQTGQQTTNQVTPDTTLSADKTISADSAKLYAINVVDLEDYLLSVVPSEMPSQWPQEALKAQAIAARSYALANLGKHLADGYDVKANTEDQVYSGVQSESDNSNLACAQTAGIILKHQGQVIPAFFHSGSGGWTEVSENVWGNTLPFLKSVPDYDDASPMASWTRTFEQEKLMQLLQAARLPANKDPNKDAVKDVSQIGQLLDVTVIARTPTNRVTQVNLIGKKREAAISAEELRKVLKLPSTNFNLSFQDGVFTFSGRGFGHGLGLSQWGAKALADNGYNAAQILKYYYKDVALEYR
jgi:SpoIID/LytB domain protein